MNQLDAMHTVVQLRHHWMDTLARVRQQSAMPGGFHIEKLSDEFGQYTLILKCAECGHERKTEPTTLGRLCGWDARLADVAKRMRCSKCGKRRCNLKAFPPKKPRGYTALPK
jgi:hypothetical protein